MSWIARLFGSAGGKKSAPQDAFRSKPAPEETFYAIGDVHGRLDLLERLVARIREEDPAARIVCVGDYIDRGEQSREVLEFLQSDGAATKPPWICLNGNHEQMCLKFLADPDKYSDRWLRFGGLQTLASYGVGLGGGRGNSTRMRDALAAAMGETTIAWLETRPTHWQSGNVAVVHAGADPFLPIGEQADGTLMWGHKDFGTVTRPDGVWVVHGHTIVDAPSVHNGRIAVDTGAYATGRLTAARVSADGVCFLTV